ncbi:MAG: PspC domain-containing protein [archaeon]
MEPKKLYRSRENKVLAGVCGGIGEYFSIDPVWIRLAFVLFAMAHGIGVLIYIVGWIIIPENPDHKTGKKTTAENTVDRIRSELKSCKTSKVKCQGNGTVAFGVFLLFIGSVLLLKNIFSWFSFSYIWPLSLIALAIYLITKSASK